MGDDDVERLTGAQYTVRQRLERNFLEMDVGQFRLLRERPGVFDVRGIEIETQKFGMRVGGGGDQDAQAVAATEIRIAERHRKVGRTVTQKNGTGGEPG